MQHHNNLLDTPIKGKTSWYEITWLCEVLYYGLGLGLSFGAIIIADAIIPAYDGLCKDNIERLIKFLILLGVLAAIIVTLCLSCRAYLRDKNLEAIFDASTEAILSVITLPFTFYMIIFIKDGFFVVTHEPMVYGLHWYMDMGLILVIIFLVLFWLGEPLDFEKEVVTEG